MGRVPTESVKAWPTVDSAFLQHAPGIDQPGRSSVQDGAIQRDAIVPRTPGPLRLAVTDEPRPRVGRGRHRELHKEGNPNPFDSSAGTSVGSTANFEPSHKRARREPGTIASARGLVKRYGNGETAVNALDGVDLDLRSGEFTAIMGPSGSGKSTLMHCMAGLDSVTEGSVILDELNLSELSERELTAIRRTRIGFIFQSFNLIPTLTAAENITLPLEIAREHVDIEWRDTVVRRVGLASRLSHRPHELSGGQQQRVACARALISRPALIFADEPTGNLDSMASAEVLSLLRDAVVELGQSVVMVTHDASAAAYAHRVVFLADGKIVAEIRRPTPNGILEMLQAITAS